MRAGDIVPAARRIAGLGLDNVLNQARRQAVRMGERNGSASLVELFFGKRKD
ncbi:hypothetical protein [Dechloromonas denitrificans]|uniref:hypothetical protein n=1 Tax=Dechloromonas denitrificans TaxID=281362 RepID=UPI0012F9DF9E|nr:hypothetical protein [Dechloromonas denitrificans]